MTQKLSGNAASQCNRILEYLRTKSLTTIDARTELDIMHPSARVQELKEQGHNIVTYWEVVDNGQGKHRIANYVLFSKKGSAK